MKNILIVIPSLTLWWWAEKVAVDIGDFLWEDLNIFYYTFHEDIHKYPHRWKYYSLKQKSGSSLLKIFMFPVNSFLLYRFCRKNKIDVIISHMERANIISILASIFLPQVKQISVVHSFKYSLQIFNKILIKIFYKYSDKVVSVSGWVEDMLKQNFQLKNTILIYNSFDIEHTRSLSHHDIEPQDASLFNQNIYSYISIWKLRDAKAQDRLIDAFSHVHMQDTHTQLIILWEWPYQKQLEKKIREKNLKESVKLIWIRENIFPYLKHSDCFVFSSKWEWFGIVLVEALASWLSVVSTDCLCGPREILAPEVTLWENIEYPYVWKYGILESNSDFDSRSFAKSMIDIKEWKFTFEPGGYNMFDRKNILQKWAELIW